MITMKINSKARWNFPFLGSHEPENNFHLHRVTLIVNFVWMNPRSIREDSLQNVNYRAAPWGNSLDFTCRLTNLFNFNWVDKFSPIRLSRKSLENSITLSSRRRLQTWVEVNWKRDEEVDDVFMPWIFPQLFLLMSLNWYRELQSWNENYVWNGNWLSTCESTATGCIFAFEIT